MEDGAVVARRRRKPPTGWQLDVVDRRPITSYGAAVVDVRARHEQELLGTCFGLPGDLRCRMDPARQALDLRDIKDRVGPQQGNDPFRDIIFAFVRIRVDRYIELLQPPK